jgi:hypothetical protein
VQQARLATLLFDLLTAEEERGAGDRRDRLGQHPSRAAPLADRPVRRQLGRGRGPDCGGGPHQLTVIGGAGHLFEQPGTLEQVADAAVDWFSRQLAQRA